MGICYNGSDPREVAIANAFMSDQAAANATYRRSQERVQRLEQALRGLKLHGDCWCGVAIGNPMMRDHSDACKAAKAALGE